MWLGYWPPLDKEEQFPCFTEWLVKFHNVVICLAQKLFLTRRTCEKSVHLSLPAVKKRTTIWIIQCLSYWKTPSAFWDCHQNGSRRPTGRTCRQQARRESPSPHYPCDSRCRSVFQADRGRRRDTCRDPSHS